MNTATAHAAEQLVLPGCPAPSDASDAERFAAMASEVMAHALRLNYQGCFIKCEVQGVVGLNLDIWSPLPGPAPRRPLYGNAISFATACPKKGLEGERDRYIRESYCAHPHWTQYGDPFEALEAMLQALNYVERNIGAFQVARVLEA